MPFISHQRAHVRWWVELKYRQGDGIETIVVARQFRRASGGCGGRCCEPEVPVAMSELHVEVFGPNGLVARRLIADPGRLGNGHSPLQVHLPVCEIVSSLQNTRAECK